MTKPQNTPERRYRMTRLSAGDYLLPGNDGETIFRVSKYTEDGSLETGDGKTITGVFWAAYRWPKARTQLTTDQYGYDPYDDWDAWVLIADLLPSRQSAIDEALTWEWRRDNPVHGPEREPKAIDFSFMFARQGKE